MDKFKNYPSISLIYYFYKNLNNLIYFIIK